MATQTALAITKIGKPLTKIAVPIPSPKENELLIKLTAAGLAPVDQKFRDHGLFNIEKFIPAVISGDLVDVVTAHGPGTDASAFPIGSHVFSQAADFFSGGLQEYSLIDARYTALVPSNISDLDAALFPVNVVTSAASLFSASGFGIPFPGSEESKGFDYSKLKVVVVGGGTNTGKLAIMMLRIAGIGMIVVTASLEGEAELKRYGATHVVDRKASDVTPRVRAIVGDDLVMVYNTFSAADHSLAVSFLSETNKGKVVSLVGGKASGEAAALKKGGYEESHTSGFSSKYPEVATPLWKKQFPKWVESGEIEVLKYGVIEGLDADAVNKVLDGYKEGNLGRGERFHVRI